MLAAIERKYLQRSHRVESKTELVGRDRVEPDLSFSMIIIPCSYALYLYRHCTCIAVLVLCLPCGVVYCSYLFGLLVVVYG